MQCLFPSSNVVHTQKLKETHYASLTQGNTSPWCLNEMLWLLRSSPVEIQTTVWEIFSYSSSLLNWFSELRLMGRWDWYANVWTRVWKRWVLHYIFPLNLTVVHLCWMICIVPLVYHNGSVSTTPEVLGSLFLCAVVYLEKQWGIKCLL